MNGNCLRLNADQYDLLRMVGSNLSKGICLSSRDLRLSSLAVLIGCEFVEFETGRLVIMRRGQQFLRDCEEHPDGTASVHHDKLERGPFERPKFKADASGDA